DGTRLDPAHPQPRAARRRLRPRLRPRARPRVPTPRRPLQLLRVRRDQRVRGVAQRLTAPRRPLPRALRGLRRAGLRASGSGLRFARPRSFAPGGEPGPAPRLLPPPAQPARSLAAGTPAEPTPRAARPVPGDAVPRA